MSLWKIIQSHNLLYLSVLKTIAAASSAKLPQTWIQLRRFFPHFSWTTRYKGSTTNHIRWEEGDTWSRSRAPLGHSSECDGPFADLLTDLGERPASGWNARTNCQCAVHQYYTHGACVYLDRSVSFPYTHAWPTHAAGSKTVIGSGTASSGTAELIVLPVCPQTQFKLLIMVTPVESCVFILSFSFFFFSEKISFIVGVRIILRQAWEIVASPIMGALL